MWDVYEEASFSEKLFTNKLNMGLLLRVWVENTVNRLETYWLSGKEKSSGRSGQ